MGFNTALHIDEINCVSELQARHDIDPESADDIAKAIKSKVRIERPQIMRVSDRNLAYFVVDGFDRVEGYRRAGVHTVPVVVTDGTWQDARDAAARANAKHLARKRTGEDKRRAARMMLEDHPEWTDNRIAKHISVSPTIVGEERENLPKAKAVTQRVGIDKKVRKSPKPRRQASEGETKRAKPTTFDWTRFDTYFGWLKKGADVLVELTGENAANAETAHEHLNRAFEWFQRRRKQLEG